MSVRTFTIALCGLLLTTGQALGQDFHINAAGWFEKQGAGVMVFDDVYPEGHQGGITVVTAGQRRAACGDIRFEATPGQWQGLPKVKSRRVDEESNTITVELAYPDSIKHQTGFNPMLYADFAFGYRIQVKGEPDGVVVTVDIDRPVPETFAGKLGFNLELVPSTLFGQPWLMDEVPGMFPHQAMGPTLSQPSNTEHLGDYFVPEWRHPRFPGRTFKQTKARLDYLIHDKHVYNPMVADDIISQPMAEGRTFVLNPHDETGKVVIESQLGTLKLYDGRMNHNNGWFVLRSEFKAGDWGTVAKWVIRPAANPAWRYRPVVQTSQVGYHPQQPKQAVIELDSRDEVTEAVRLYRITGQGKELVKEDAGQQWGRFRRYNYLVFDFTEIQTEGLYQVEYAGSSSVPFRIAADVWQKGVWQAEIEYFLPVQMCHVRVNEKYRVWHDLCHEDDARMAPLDFNHLDGYIQGPSTLCKYQPGDLVPGLNIGGWHDAGDYDLRIESQSVQAYLLALEVENLQAYWDETTIDFDRRVVEIHQPDGKNDFLQQVENGALTIVAGWKAFGRLYRGIVCPTVRQYVHLGDAAAHTDHQTGTGDDRWVFTEENPSREMQVAAYLAAISRVLKGYNDPLSKECLEIAETLYSTTPAEGERMTSVKLHAAVELFLATSKEEYSAFVLSQTRYICSHIQQTGWYIGRFDQKAGDRKFSKAVRAALPEVKEMYDRFLTSTPYGVASDRGNRSSGSWEPQRDGFVYCMLHESYPDLFDTAYISRCVQFFLGMHPGQRRSSFVAGVGSETVRAAYGGNRADFSYIPGSVTPGTNLIRPDLPELLEYPFIWQQGEFCIDGHNTWFTYMAMTLARLYK